MHICHYNLQKVEFVGFFKNCLYCCNSKYFLAIYKIWVISFLKISNIASTIIKFSFWFLQSNFHFPITLFSFHNHHFNLHSHKRFCFFKAKNLNLLVALSWIDIVLTYCILTGSSYYTLVIKNLGSFIFLESVAPLVQFNYFRDFRVQNILQNLSSK